MAYFLLEINKRFSSLLNATKIDSTGFTVLLPRQLRQNYIFKLKNFKLTPYYNNYFSKRHLDKTLQIEIVIFNSFY